MGRKVSSATAGKLPAKLSDAHNLAYRAAIMERDAAATEFAVASAHVELIEVALFAQYGIKKGDNVKEDGTILRAG